MDFPPEVSKAFEILHRGDSSMKQSRAFHRGTLMRISPYFYVTPQDWVACTHRERLMVAITSTCLRRSDLVLCGTAALAMQGVDVPTPAEVTFVTPQRARSGLQPHRFLVPGTSPMHVQAHRLAPPRVRLHLHRTASPTVRCGPFQVQAPAWALAEALTTQAPERALACADAFARTHPEVRLSSWEPLRDAVSSLPHATKRRRAEGLIAHASPQSDSVGESMARGLIIALGFPAPVLQMEYSDREGFIGRADFSWPEFGVIVEFDGAAKHVDPSMTGGQGTYRTVNKAAGRSNRLSAVCRKLVHLRWEDLQHPERVRALLVAAGLPLRSAMAPW